MGIQAPAEVKFALIHEAALREGNLLKIGKLCEIAGVSRSGYYNWCACEPARKRRADADQKEFDLILEAYRFRGYHKGAPRNPYAAPPHGSHHEREENQEADAKVQPEMSNTES